VKREVICIAGGTGLVGSRLIEILSDKYDFNLLSRSPGKNTANIRYFQWDIDNLTIDEKALDCDHIINLTGAGIADKRWTESRKRLLISSRVNSNKTLVKAMSTSGRKYKSVSCASAIGYYGERGNEILTENSKNGVGFLSECSVLWEESAKDLTPFTDHFSILRIGVVLSVKDGALPKMLMTKNVGILSYFGNGNQYYSWIHIDDLVSIFEKLADHVLPSGIINAVAPEPLSNKNMMHSIASALGGIPLVIPAPAFGLRMALGEMADVVLNSTRVIPKFLTDHQFEWKFRDVGQAVVDLIKREI
jgi:uncharacterized protein (TIGR01777 family)